jgi:hypothetical protein
MARKKAAGNRKHKDSSPSRTEAAPVSELAALVLSCKEQWENRLILADWMEERLHLAATARVLRSPDLQLLTKAWDGSEQFEYFSLEHDVFVWLARGDCITDQVRFQTKPYMALGLYAHPKGQPEMWVKVVGITALEEDTQRDSQRPWFRAVKSHPLVDEAREELAAFVKQKS